MKLRLALLLALCLPLQMSAQNHSGQKRPGQRPQGRNLARKNNESIRWLPRVDSRDEFDSLARVYYAGRFQALPHLMFVIDRAAKAKGGNRVYYVNSKRYSFHSEFANANYLTLERGREFFRRNYLEANRRFILGTIAYQTKIGKFTFELWEGDMATPEILREAYAVIGASFFAPVLFKPNSAGQEEASSRLLESGANFSRVLSSEINPPKDYLPLNMAVGVGMLRIIDRMTEETIIDRNEIIIFRES